MTLPFTTSSAGAARPGARRPCTRVAVLALGLLAFAAPPAGASGGDGFSENAYAPEYHVPAPELAEHAAGRLGVLQPSHYRVYLVLAWRAMHGLTMTPGQVKALNLRGWRVGPEGNGEELAWDDQRNGVNAWLAARAAVAPPLPEKGKPGVLKDVGHYVNILNCPPTAFDHAARTLRDRVQRHGVAAAQAWVAGQDAVWANCTGRAGPGPAPTGGQTAVPTAVLPPTLPADAPAWLQHDRAYQRAAALFYAGQFDPARKAFLAIAADTRSPWQPLGAYLGTRCLLRQATLMPTPESGGTSLVPEARALLETARRELQAQADTLPAAGRLIGWVDARLQPQARAAELARSLQSGALDSPERVLALGDYLYLLDILEGGPDGADAAEPLTAWISALQAASSAPAPGDASGAATDAQHRGELARHMGQRWRQDRDPAWLLPLVIQARQLADLPADALQALRALPGTHPAWHTARWHLARLSLTAPAPDARANADAEVDAALAGAGGPLSPSTRNRWRQLKLASARSLEAMLAAAPRNLAEPGAAGPVPDEGRRGAAPGTVADTVGVDTDLPLRLYRHLPLSQLSGLLGRPELPAAFRKELAEVVFTRALLMQDWATANRLAPEIAAPRATTQHLYRRLVQATALQDRQLAAALILVNTPELNPSPVNANGATMYWGCGSYAGSGSALGLSDPLLAVAPAFLSAAERSQVTQEQARLMALPLRTRWLADTLLRWAATRPDDAEAPKALHFLVASTRMECSIGVAPAAASAPVGNHSREAFQLLHRLWPRSEWAARTKYWF